MNPENERDLKRLRDAMTHSREKLRPFRENRLDAIRQYVGSHYGDNGAYEDVPVNFLELAVSIYTQQLVGAAPRAYVATNVEELRNGAAELKIALDYSIEKMRLEETLWRVVMDALFFQGIVKIGMAESSPGELQGWWGGVGEPFTLWVDPDDWVQDMNAKTWESMGYCGNRYRMPLDEAREFDGYHPARRKRLRRTVKQATTEQGDELADTITGGMDVERDEYEDEVELWELWLPRERLVVTVDAENEEAKPLRVVEWKGPPQGPFLPLGFDVVPSNALPLPPVAIWKDMHDLANALYLKLGRQALNQKTILPFRGGSEEDAQRIRDSRDGDILRVDGETPKEVSYGGPSQINLAFFLGLNELFNRHAGNLDTMGGLGSAADTLGQEEMLSANASQRLVFMRRKLTHFVDRILTGIAHYLYEDPFVELPLSRPIGNSGLSIPIPWTAQSREGKPGLFQIAIEPYSMVYRQPEGQVKQLMEAWNGVVMPAAQLLPPQNLVAATEKLLHMIADKANLPELSELIPHLMVPPEQLAQQQQQQGGAGKPATTTRNYVRKNVPGGSRSQKESALAQALMGSMPQPAEAAAMMR